jgi:hypothetical protein
MFVPSTMRVLTKCLAVGTALLAGASGFCADKGAPLIAHPDPVTLPGLGRVLFGFVATVALAVSIVYALRKWLPRFANNKSATLNQVNLRAHCTVHNGIRFHVVTVAEKTILVAEGKTGIAMTVVSTAEKGTDATS